MKNYFPKVGDVMFGVVIRLYPRYAVLMFDKNLTGLLHISEVSHFFVYNFTSYITIGNVYRVTVIQSDENKKQLKVSIKALSNEERHNHLPKVDISHLDISFEGLKKHLPIWLNKVKEE